MIFYVKVDFPYTLDLNYRPILHVQILSIYREYKSGKFIIENYNREKNKKRFAKINFTQVITHLHHVPSLGINLKPGFDIDYYKKLGYQASVKRQITYNRRKSYFLLIDQYLTQSVPLP